MKEYIGVLDSGVGGLSVLAELYKTMPDKNYIFFGDTKNIPYGTKTKEELYDCTKNILDFFMSKNVKNVVFACNTTSAVVYEELKETFKNKLKLFPLIQTIAFDAQSDLKNNDTIAILATKATINSKKYEEEIHKYNPNLNVIGIDCTGFVEIVENRTYDDLASINLIKEKLEKAKNASRIVLGCTHYPYLVKIFKKYLNTDYFNPAICLAKAIKNKLGSNQNEKGEVKFYTSSNPDNFKESGKIFFNINQDVILTNLEVQKTGI